MEFYCKIFKMNFDDSAVWPRYYIICNEERLISKSTIQMNEQNI